MSLPIVCIPPVLNQLFRPYQPLFSGPQYRHFRRLMTGLIVSGNKTLQEINDAFGSCDQSNLNRFINSSPWNPQELNRLRIKQVKDTLCLCKKGILIVDETLLHKTGRNMEYAGMHRSGVTKTLEWGHMVVNSYYTDTDDNRFPVKTGLYIKESDCNSHSIPFKTKRQIAIEQVDYSLEQGLNIGLVSVDAGYEGSEFTQELRSRGLDYLIGVRTSTKVSVDRQKRIGIAGYLDTLTDADFSILSTPDKAYFYHTVKVCIREIGCVRLVISYTLGDEGNVKCYITNLKEKDETIMKLLVKRWEIECFHRDAKQHLGLESYQVRKGRGMQTVALTILAAYTLVILAARILKTPIRCFKTVGEVCRYLTLIAYKGIRWINALVSKPSELTECLKKHVFVKNAKV
jgi:SRSO17 transposase